MFHKENQSLIMATKIAAIVIGGGQGIGKAIHKSAAERTIQGMALMSLMFLSTEVSLT